MDNQRSYYFLAVALVASGLQLASASCELSAVGLADGYILDSQLTASSELNINTSAKNGRLNYTAGSSWCASTGDSNPYLQIDLHTLHIICAVSTQGNSQADQWVETYTLKSSTDGTTWTKVKGFNGNYNQNSTVKHILYSGIVARYLRFVAGVKHGAVCFRVEVFGIPRSKGNNALFKPTAQSGTYVFGNNPLRSSNAVDGGNKTHYSYCSHTDDSTNTNPWWRVDLGRVEPVAEVRILNRGDCCGSYLDGAEIRVGNLTSNGGATNHLCTGNIQVPQGKEEVFFCKPKALGRYVSISLSGIKKYVTLCEVEVYPTYISNLALNQPASQVSTVHGGVASRAVDGKITTAYIWGSCTHTNYATDPWWRVDLGSPLPVAEVVIVNRACSDACAGFLSAFEIRIGNNNQTGGQSNPSCGGSHSMNSGETKSFYCDPPLVGQYVFIRIPGNRKILSICEVEVYSTRTTGNNLKACALDPVGISSSSAIPDQRFSASSSRSGSNPSDGRLKGSSAWVPGSNSNSNDYLQIDLGSVYFVCGVATQGNPNADDWTKTYKIATSLDNVNWKMYAENNVEKNITGNDDQTSIVRSELYQPVAAKFIRFYPVSFNNNKALRVEVYGSMQGCLSSMASERGLTRQFGMTASSELDDRHRAGYSRLYGIKSWCSSSVSPPQYLEANLRKVITVTGIATQGDNEVDKWVTSYTISYGYDKRTWFYYASGQQLAGNSDKATIVVRWLSTPFAAQYVRIIPKTYNNGTCMRVDLFACEDFQAPFLFVDKLENLSLPASPSTSVTLNCIAKFSLQRPPAYNWSKDGTILSESSSSLTITYSSATNIYKNYHCTRKSVSLRDVQCSSTYQCSASLPGLQVKGDTKGNVTVTLRVPGQPAVQVKQINIKARSTTVTWSYSPGSDEAPIVSFYLHYQNKSFNDSITLSSFLSSKELIHLKPYTSYSVRMMAESVLGKGDWSSFVAFTTSTAAPEVTVQLVNVTGVTSQSIYVEWRKPSLDKLNGPLGGYSISYKEVGGTPVTLSPSSSSTFFTLRNLKIWTKYLVKITVNNGDFIGLWSAEQEALTKQDAPSVPQNLQLRVQGPSGNTRPQMTVTWGKPVNENGFIRKYTLVYGYTFEGKKTSSGHSTNGQTFSYSFSVLGGIQYTVELWAETIKPGPKATKSKHVPVYKPSVAPRKITSSKINETTYRVSWNPLPREVSNGEVIAYEVKQTTVSRSRTTRAISGEQIVLQNTTDTSAVLFDLKSCSEYRVEVRAYTSAGPGVFGSLPWRIVSTAPGPPSDVRIGNTPKKRSINLLWNKPKQHGDDVKEYTVIYEGMKDYFPSFKDAGTRKTKSLDEDVTGLYPGTKYTFVVMAKTHCGDGDNSTMALGQTLMDAPEAPAFHEPVDVSTNETSVNVTVWSAAQNNGPISYYQLLVHRVKDWSDTISAWKNFGPDFYITAQIPAATVNPSKVFVVGDGKRYYGYHNKKLLSGQKYTIHARGLSTMMKKASCEMQFLNGEASLIARIDVKKDEQGTECKSENPTQTGGLGNADKSEKSSDTGTILLVSVIANIVLGILLSLFVALNVYFCRSRRSSSTAEKYSANTVKVDEPANEQGDGVDPPLQEASNYMELQPTRRRHEAAEVAAQYMNTMSQYQPLTRRTEKDPKPKQAYENVNFQACPEKKGNGAEIYEEVNA